MTARTTQRTQHHLIFEFWLVFSEDGSVRLTRTMPRLDRNERSMFMSSKLPKSLWITPSLRASIEVDQDQAPAEIKLDVAAASEALRAALGVDIDLVIHQPNDRE